jgi:hypothetical protein
MNKAQFREILEKVLTWPPEDRERVARFVHEIEQHRNVEDLTEDDWRIIEERARRRELASDEQVEAVFSRYRHP